MTPELDQEFGPGTLHALRAKVLVQACRRAFRRAGPRMWFLPFTNWRPMPSAMARGRDGCASGTWSGNCVVRLTMVIRRDPTIAPGIRPAR